MSEALRISEDVVFEVLDDEAILLHVQDGTYYRLNKTGTRVWQLLEESADRTRIVDTIAAEFDASPDTIAADVETLLEDLAAKGLVTAG